MVRLPHRLHCTHPYFRELKLPPHLKRPCQQCLQYAPWLDLYSVQTGPKNSEDIYVCQDCVLLESKEW